MNNSPAVNEADLDRDKWKEIAHDLAARLTLCERQCAELRKENNQTNRILRRIIPNTADEKEAVLDSNLFEPLRYCGELTKRDLELYPVGNTLHDFVKGRFEQAKLMLEILDDILK